MQNKPYILIKDARKRWRVNGVQKEGRGFRVCLVASNNEMLAQSEVLNTVKAVSKNINATIAMFKPHESLPTSGFSTAKEYAIELRYKGTDKQMKNQINK
jgi:hypothetical protein